MNTDGTSVFSSAERKWKVWKHSTGMTSCYCGHMKRNHNKEYEQAIVKHGLKEQDDEGLGGGKAQPEGCVPFTIEMFHHLLMKWIVADDQVS